MTISTPVSLTRSRDADNTRQLLLQAARRRFAEDGYPGTTVRDIATDAGVNVALINRYFISKGGLFEACITSAGEELGPPEDAEMTLERIVQIVVAKLTDSPSGDRSLQLLLLLRTSGDERADEIRRTILESFADQVAVAAGWNPGPDGERLRLRAQIALATAVGIVVLRSATGLEPLTSAVGDELGNPLVEVLSLLLLRSSDNAA